MNIYNPLFIFLWLPQIGAELAMRKKPELSRQPLGIYEEKYNKKVLKFLNLLAINKGLKLTRCFFNLPQPDYCKKKHTG